MRDLPPATVDHSAGNVRQKVMLEIFAYGAVRRLQQRDRVASAQCRKVGYDRVFGLYRLNRDKLANVAELYRNALDPRRKFGIADRPAGKDQSRPVAVGRQIVENRHPERVILLWAFQAAEGGLLL
jgi:hypothetical protein